MAFCMGWYLGEGICSFHEKYSLNGYTRGRSNRLWNMTSALAKSVMTSSCGRTCDEHCKNCASKKTNMSSVPIAAARKSVKAFKGLNAGFLGSPNCMIALENSVVGCATSKFLSTKKATLGASLGKRARCAEKRETVSMSETGSAADPSHFPILGTTWNK
eukprot:588742-Rhodomonas_salina.2